MTMIVHDLTHDVNEEQVSETAALKRLFDPAARMQIRNTGDPMRRSQR